MTASTSATLFGLHTKQHRPDKRTCFIVTQSPLNCLQRGMLSKREQQRHERVTPCGQRSSVEMPAEKENLRSPSPTYLSTSSSWRSDRTPRPRQWTQWPHCCPNVWDSARCEQCTHNLLAHWKGAVAHASQLDLPWFWLRPTSAQCPQRRPLSHRHLASATPLIAPNGVLQYLAHSLVAKREIATTSKPHCRERWTNGRLLSLKCFRKGVLVERGVTWEARSVLEEVYFQEEGGRVMEKRPGRESECVLGKKERLLLQGKNVFLRREGHDVC